MSWAVFVGAKGGVGTTTLLWEMSKALAPSGRVALVDADFSGHRALAVMSGSTHEFDAARAGEPISVVKVQGVTAVELTESFDAMLSVTPESTETLAATLDAGYAMAYVDASQPFAAATRPFMLRASRYVVVVPPTLLGITGARATLNDMARFGFPKERTAAVLVSIHGRPEIAPAEIERALGVSLIGTVPSLSDRGWRKAIESINSALLAVPDEPRLDASVTSAPNQVQLGERRKARRTPPAQDVSNEESGNRAFDAVAAFTTILDEAAVKRSALKMEIHAELGFRMDSMQSGSASQAQMQKEVEDLIAAIVQERRSESGSPEESSQLHQEILDEALGLGPLEDLLRDDAISEIMVNGPDVVYVERAGQLTLSNARFTSEQQLRQTIDRIITPLGRRIDEAQPMVDARLPDGSRVNAIIAPLALEGGMLTIRRFGKKRMGIADLLRLGALNEPMVQFIRACVESRLNIVVSGGTGSGKTTLLNIVSNFIPDGDRIITIEDAAELALAKSHVGRLESRAPNIEGKGAITIRDLVRNALRMRPDRIVVGECRGGEALDMLQAMNTGHDGSLTTLHANSPRDSISRLETLVMMAGYDLPVRAIREQIASAIDLVIQTARLRDGSRKIMAITEVIGMEGDVVTMQDIVTFAMQGVDEHGQVSGQFQFTGVQPKALARFDDHGVAYDVRQLSSMASAANLW